MATKSNNNVQNDITKVIQEKEKELETKAIEALEEEKKETILKKAQEYKDKKTINDLKRELEEKARKLRVVVVSPTDPETASIETTAVVSCCNSSGLIMGKIVPLNKPVELEEGLIATLKEAKRPSHVQDPVTKMYKFNELTVVPKYIVTDYIVSKDSKSI